MVFPCAECNHCLGNVWMHVCIITSSHTHILTYTTSLTSYTTHACRHAICTHIHTHTHTTHAYTHTHSHTYSSHTHTHTLTYIQHMHTHWHHVALLVYVLHYGQQIVVVCHAQTCQLRRSKFGNTKEAFANLDLHKTNHPQPSGWVDARLEHQKAWAWAIYRLTM